MNRYNHFFTVKIKQILSVFFALILFCASGCTDDDGSNPTPTASPTPFNPPKKVAQEDGPIEYGTIIEVTASDDINQVMAQAGAMLDKATYSNPVIVTIVMEDGVYILDETVSISAKSEFATLNIVAKDGAKPIISGLQNIDPAGFSKVEGQEYYLYQFTQDENGKYPVFRDLYVDGNRAQISKSETYVSQEHFTSTDAAVQQGIYIDPTLAAQLPIDDMADCQLYMSADWEYYIVHVDSVDMNNTKNYNGNEHVMLKLDQTQLQEWMSRHNRVLQMNNRGYYLMNHPVLINEDGEYAYDSTTGRLWYRPANGKSIENINFSYSTIETLFSFTDMHNVVISGLTFTGTTCKQIPENGYLSAQANGESRKGGPLHIAAIYIMNGDNISIRNCTFDNIGNNGVMFRKKTTNASITGCDFKNIAMSAITIGEHGWTWSDSNCATDIKIYNNYLEHIGYEYPSAVAIFISLVKDAKILNNTIIDTAYTGINVGWGWGYATFKYEESYCVNNVEVAYNRIEKYMQVTRDGGAVYILGSSAEETYRENFNFLHDNYAYNENADPKQIAYYLDEASANWHVYDNVSIGALRSLFVQHEAGNFARNILVERLYADEYISPKNANEERHVIVKDIKLAKQDDMYTKYPEARLIEYMSGCIRDAQ